MSASTTTAQVISDSVPAKAPKRKLAPKMSAERYATLIVGDKVTHRESGKVYVVTAVGNADGKVRGVLDASVAGQVKEGQANPTRPLSADSLSEPVEASQPAAAQVETPAAAEPKVEQPAKEVAPNGPAAKLARQKGKKAPKVETPAQVEQPVETKPAVETPVQQAPAPAIETPKTETPVAKPAAPKSAPKPEAKPAKFVFNLSGTNRYERLTAARSTQRNKNRTLNGKAGSWVQVAESAVPAGTQIVEPEEVETPVNPKLIFNLEGTEKYHRIEADRAAWRNTERTKKEQAGRWIEVAEKDVPESAKIDEPVGSVEELRKGIQGTSAKDAEFHARATRQVLKTEAAAEEPAGEGKPEPKAKKAAAASDKAPRPEWNGLGMCDFIRYGGSQGWDKKVIAAVAVKIGFTPSPTTIHIQTKKGVEGENVPTVDKSVANELKAFAAAEKLDAKAEKLPAVKGKAEAEPMQVRKPSKKA